MSVEISLVEIVMFKFQKDTTTIDDFLQNEIDWSYPNWENCIKDLPSKSDHILNQDNIIFTKNCYCFIFDFFGQSYDYSYASGLEFEFIEGYGGEMFEGWEEDFIKYGNKLFDEFRQKQESLKEPDYNRNAVRFITVWEYSSFVDSYNNEFESEWNLIGLLDLDNIKNLLNKDMKVE